MRDLPRILHVTAGIARQQGGPALNAIGIARTIRAAGGTNVIFSTDNREPASSRVRTHLAKADIPTEADGLEVELFPQTWPHRVMYSRELGQTLERRVKEFDVVHIHSLFLYPQFAAQRAARRHDVPYIVTIHGCLDPALRSRSRVMKAVSDIAWQRRMLDGAAALHYTTSSERDLAADLGYQAPPVVIPNGIDWRAFQGSGTGSRRSDNDDPVVLYLGRMSHKKGLDVLIEAFVQVREEIPSSRLVLAGPDDEDLTPELVRLAKELGVLDGVEFTGLLDETGRLAVLKSAEVWVLPSRTENFGTSVIEAMAAGLPVVISPAVNIAAEIAVAGAGVVCERSPKTLAGALIHVLSDDEERARLRTAARSWAQAYDWASLAPRLLSLYQAAAARAVGE